MSEALAPVAPACPNCGADAPHAYCARCGQSQRDRLRASVRELAGEGLAELTDFDAKLWVTLRRLVARPGLLTSEYIAGRRARYIRPLRLYLTASVLFFIAFAFLPPPVLTADGRADADGFDFSISRGTAGRDAPPAANTSDAPSEGLTVGGDEQDGALERRVEDRVARFQRAEPAERVRMVIDGLQRHLPKAFFLLVPLFALGLRTLHWGRGFTYAEHLIFALHLHAFVFLVAAAALLLPPLPGGLVLPAVVLWTIAYAFIALRRVFRRGRLGAAATLAIVLPAYMVAVIASSVLAIMIALTLG